MMREGEEDADDRSEGRGGNDQRKETFVEVRLLTEGQISGVQRVTLVSRLRRLRT